MGSISKPKAETKGKVFVYYILGNKVAKKKNLKWMFKYRERKGFFFLNRPLFQVKGVQKKHREWHLGCYIKGNIKEKGQKGCCIEGNTPTNRLKERGGL